MTPCSATRTQAGNDFKPLHRNGTGAFLLPGLRRRLPPENLRLVGFLAVVLVEEEQAVNQLAGPTPNAIDLPTPRMRRQAFIRPGLDMRLKK